jgi:hypothetical protein
VHGSADPTPTLFEAGKQYIMVAATRPKLQEIVERAKNHKDGVFYNLRRGLKTLGTEDECLEFFWQGWDDVLALLGRDGQPRLSSESQLLTSLCKEVATPAFLGACVRADAWLCWEDESCRAERSTQPGSASLARSRRTGFVSLDLSGSLFRSEAC